GFFGKWHLGKINPYGQGFDYAADFKHINQTGEEITNDPSRTFSITNDGINWMEHQVNKGNSFFMELSYHAVHKLVATRPSTYSKVESWPESNTQPHQIKFLAGDTYDLDAAIGMI